MSLFNDITAKAMNLRAPALQSTKAPRGSLATTQGGWTLPDAPVEERHNSEQAIEKAYYGNVYAYRCIDAIANSICSLPFRAGDPVSNNFKINHTLARLLGPAPGGPNPEWSSDALLRHAIASYILMGKFAWAIERDSVGRVVGLWPLRAQHIKPIAATSGARYFSSFEYNNRGDANFRVYKPKDIVYIYRRSLADFRQAESPVDVAGLNISISKMLDTFDYNFLKNGGVPATMVVTPQFANSEDREGFQQQFLADFSGVGNAGRTFFAEREIEGEGTDTANDAVQVIPLGTNQRDAQMDVLSEREVMAITVAFGVPLSILGDSSHRTFSNAFQDRRNYWLETLLPKCREIQSGINTQLAPLLDSNIVGWFDTSGVPELRPEPAIPAAQAVAFRDAGFVTEDEIRADLGLPPGKDVGLDKVWEQKKKDAEEMKAQLGATGTDNAPDSLAKQAGTDVVPPAKAPVATAPAASRSTGHSVVPVVDSILRAQVIHLMNDQRTAVLQKLNGRRSKDGPSFDQDYWTERTISQVGPVLLAMGMTRSAVMRVARDVSLETSQMLAAGISPDEVFQGRAQVVADSIRRAITHDRVPASEIEKALLSIYNGEINVDDAVAALEDY